MEVPDRAHPVPPGRAARFADQQNCRLGVVATCRSIGHVRVAIPELLADYTRGLHGLRYIFLRSQTGTIAAVIGGQSEVVGLLLEGFLWDQLGRCFFWVCRHGLGG